MPSVTNTPSFGVIAASSAASSTANAVTRSALSGENFGKSLVASIPDVVGQIAGGALGQKIVPIWGDDPQGIWKVL